MAQVAQAGGFLAPMAPKALAIVDASADPARIGGRPVDCSCRAGFRGAHYHSPPKSAAPQAAQPTLARCLHALIIAADEAICADHESDRLVVFFDPVLAVGAMAALARQFKNIEINPFQLCEAGAGEAALDTLIVPQQAAHG
ncbi:MAG: hypothetical protein JJT95_05130 [Pararhodobacter sp.]|nr:hypothetical protein [Pararhodobacter sp.]